jgi:DNA-binding response OmpR family regulator
MQKKKILFIEDEAFLQRALNEFLIQEGFDVLSALDGEIGLQTAKREMPDLILLDIILPKRNGFEVLDDLRANDEVKNIPVILLTNLESAEDVNKAFEKGASMYLVKSNYKMEEIVKKIKETLLAK